MDVPPWVSPSPCSSWCYRRVSRHYLWHFATNLHVQLGLWLPTHTVNSPRPRSIPWDTIFQRWSLAADINCIQVSRRTSETLSSLPAQDNHLHRQVWRQLDAIASSDLLIWGGSTPSWSETLVAHRVCIADSNSRRNLWRNYCQEELWCLLTCYWPEFLSEL